MIWKRITACVLLLLISFALPAALDAPKEKADSFTVPYRLTPTKHVLVRAKLNGKGPYHFILDTGAPALFVGTAVARKVGVAANDDGWGVFDRFELEGGLVIAKAQGQIADPFQLDGMNQMGLAGAELHGVIGYNLLARYKIELDYRRDTMTWTRLPGFEPEMPQRMGKAPANLNAMAGLVKMASALMGKREAAELRYGGFLGIELADQDGQVHITAVLEESPAAAAGLLKGDRLTRFQDQDVKETAQVEKLASKLAAGDAARLTVNRGGEEKQITAKLGKGF